ncbi:MAG: hypothetical protein PHI27_11045 [Eubacteriales bacterium]|nr:hypothetical protein [Eubacteriales bacterium]MDD4512963.1 hypothetical protein [Eubacteriales bacterium]
MTLDDLYDAFSDFDKVDCALRKKTMGEFKAAYVYQALEYLKNGWAEKYKRYMEILKSVGFEQVWKEKVSDNILLRRRRYRHQHGRGREYNLSQIRQGYYFGNQKSRKHSHADEQAMMKSY